MLDAYRWEQVINGRATHGVFLLFAADMAHGKGGGMAGEFGRSADGEAGGVREFGGAVGVFAEADDFVFYVRVP
jgi:hypothetical protein